MLSKKKFNKEKNGSKKIQVEKKFRLKIFFVVNKIFWVNIFFWFETKKIGRKKYLGSSTRKIVTGMEEGKDFVYSMY